VDHRELCLQRDFELAGLRKSAKVTATANILSLGFIAASKLRPHEQRRRIGKTALEHFCDMVQFAYRRHARACRGHPRLSCGHSASKTWMAGTSPAMTLEKQGQPYRKMRRTLVRLWPGFIRDRLCGRCMMHRYECSGTKVLAVNNGRKCAN
jgi:hypothetical protein